MHLLPVIVLARIGSLSLLDRQCNQVQLPEPVASEILSGPESDSARQALLAGWGARVPAVSSYREVMEWSLGAGETSVLSAAYKQNGYRAVLDDAEGRKCAAALQIPVIGSIGVVLRAKQAGLIPAAGDVLYSLRQAGLNLDDQMIRALLTQVGEEWRP